MKTKLVWLGIMCFIICCFVVCASAEKIYIESNYSLTVPDGTTLYKEDIKDGIRIGSHYDYNNIKLHILLSKSKEDLLKSSYYDYYKVYGYNSQVVARYEVSEPSDGMVMSAVFNSNNYGVSVNVVFSSNEKSIQDAQDLFVAILKSVQSNSYPPKKEGLTRDSDGIWRYYVNNLFVEKTGIVEYEGGQFFVANGVLCSDANGLAEYGSQWYFLAGGQVQTQRTGLAEYGGEWFYVDKGILDVNRRGIVHYDGGQFMVAAGRILREANGLIQDPNTGKWYFVSAGQVASNYRGLALYDGHWFYVWDGVFQSNAEGYVEHDGSTFYVVGGMVQ